MSIDVQQVAMLAGACAFCLVTGANDGGTLVAVGRAIRGMVPAGALALLSLITVMAPVLIGSRVATTFTNRLVSVSIADGRPVLASAIFTAVAVTLALSRLGLPTSVTLAVIGAITGAGVETGTEVEWRTVATVLALGALAPFAGCGAAIAFGWCIRRVTIPERLAYRMRWLQVPVFLAMSAAYGTNDGQKMLAVFAIVTGTAASHAAADASVSVSIAVCFALGATWGLIRQARGATNLVPARPANSITAEAAAAATVVAASALAAPVSMTQAVAGALVGAGIHEFRRRIRWQMALRVLAAWLLTLPAAALLGALSAAVAKVMT